MSDFEGSAATNSSNLPNSSRTRIVPAHPLSFVTAHSCTDASRDTGSIDSARSPGLGIRRRRARAARDRHRPSAARLARTRASVNGSRAPDTSTGRKPLPPGVTLANCRARSGAALCNAATRESCDAIRLPPRREARNIANDDFPVPYGPVSVHARGPWSSPTAPSTRSSVRWAHPVTTYRTPIPRSTTSNSTFTERRKPVRGALRRADLGADMSPPGL